MRSKGREIRSHETLLVKFQTPGNTKNVSLAGFLAWDMMAFLLFSTSLVFFSERH